MKNYLFVLVIALLLMGCSDNEPPKKEVTFMIYMAADNSLSSFAELDIDEMERSSFDPAQANVIVQADFSMYAEDPSCRRWEITPDSLYDYQISSPVIDELGEVDTGNWKTLSSFYNWCVSNYPAERYVLSIWSHGNDWYSYATNPNKFCPDHNSSSFYDIPGGDLYNALNDFDHRPDLLIIDACHMQSLEILSEVYTKCNYLCASPDIIHEYGFPYAETITQICSSDDYSSIPEIFVASYIPGGSQNYLGQINQQVSASLINCEDFSDNSLPVIQDLTQYLTNNPENFQEIMAIRDECLEFNDLDIDIDFVQLLNELSTNDFDPQLAEIADALKNSLIQNSSSYYYPAYNVGNILITFPDSQKYQTWIDLQGDYEELKWDDLTGWSQFISALLNNIAL